MPLTMENGGIYARKSLAWMNKKIEAQLNVDEAERHPQAFSDDDFALVKADASVISEMGYSYNLTIRKIAMNRATHHLSEIYTAMADRAYTFRSRGLETGLIDQETVTMLKSMPRSAE